MGTPVIASLVALACAHTPNENHAEKQAAVKKVAPMATNSAAYSYALDRAFADLKNQSARREPAVAAATTSEVVPDLSATKDFTVSVFEKINLLAPNTKGPIVKTSYADPVVFSFAIQREGKCKDGVKLNLVPAANVAQCVQVVIKPVKSESKIK